MSNPVPLSFNVLYWDITHGMRRDQSREAGQFADSSYFVEAIRRIVAAYPDLHAIVLTEVDSGVPRSGGVDQTGEVRSVLGDAWATHWAPAFQTAARGAWREGEHEGQMGTTIAVRGRWLFEPRVLNLLPYGDNPPPNTIRPKMPEPRSLVAGAFVIRQNGLEVRGTLAGSVLELVGNQEDVNEAQLRQTMEALTSASSR